MNCFHPYLLMSAIATVAIAGLAGPISAQTNASKVVRKDFHEESTDTWRYVYTVTNDSTSTNSIDRWSLTFHQGIAGKIEELGVTQPTGWTHKVDKTNNKVTFTVDSGPVTKGSPIARGKSLAGFTVPTVSPPGSSVQDRREGEQSYKAYWYEENSKTYNDHSSGSADYTDDWRVITSWLYTSKARGKVKIGSSIHLYLENPWTAYGQGTLFFSPFKMSNPSFYLRPWGLVRVGIGGPFPLPFAMIDYGSSGTGSVQLMVPNVPKFVGIKIYLQNVEPRPRDGLSNLCVIEIVN